MLYSSLLCLIGLVFSVSMKIKIREPMYNPDNRFIHGQISGNQSIEITWNSFCGDGSGDGVVYVDGSERQTPLEIGDSAVFTTKNAPRLPLYEKKR